MSHPLEMPLTSGLTTILFLGISAVRIAIYRQCGDRTGRCGWERPLGEFTVSEGSPVTRRRSSFLLQAGHGVLSRQHAGADSSRFNPSWLPRS